MVCLQEIKAAPEQVPDLLRMIPDYWSCWHGAGGYSGVALLVRKRSARPARWGTRAFDFEQRVVAADVAAPRWPRSTCPTAARTSTRRCGSSRRCGEFACGAAQAGAPVLAVRRPERRARRHRRAPEGAQAAAPSASCRTSARRSRASWTRGSSTSGRHLDPDNDALFTWWAPWRNLRQRNIGWRIDYVLASEALAARAQRCTVLSRGGHQRPRAGGGGDRVRGLR